MAKGNEAFREWDGAGSLEAALRKRLKGRALDDEARAILDDLYEKGKRAKGAEALGGLIGKAGDALLARYGA